MMLLQCQLFQTSLVVELLPPPPPEYSRPKIFYRNWQSWSRSAGRGGALRSELFFIRTNHDAVHVSVVMTTKTGVRTEVIEPTVAILSHSENSAVHFARLVITDRQKNGREMSKSKAKHIYGQMYKDSGNTLKKQWHMQKKSQWGNILSKLSPSTGGGGSFD